MNIPNKIVRLKPGENFVRVLLPNNEGTVEIRMGLETASGHGRIRVDVQADSEQYGPDSNGCTWEVENGDPGPGVVFLTVKDREAR